MTGQKIRTQDLGVAIGRESIVANYLSFGGPGASQNPVPSLGAKWYSSLHRSLSLRRAVPNSPPVQVLAFRGNGDAVSFTHPGSNTYAAEAPGLLLTMAPEMLNGSPTNRILLTDSAGNVETYDAHNLDYSKQAELVRIDYASGGYVNFSYANGLMTSAADNTGRTVQFNYSSATGQAADSELTSISTPEGRSIAFTYDANRMLTSITWADGKSVQYLYENPAIVWALTGIVDENNSRLFNFTYDVSGKAIDSQYANGAEQYSVFYSDSHMVWSSVDTWEPPFLVRRWGLLELTPGSVTVTPPNGQLVTPTTSYVNGTNVISGQSQPAGSGCGASSNATTYNSLGYVLSRDDFNGNRICYAYDANGREVTRVEGLSNTGACGSVTPAGAPLPAGARKVTTKWHPDFRKPTVVITPGAVTTSIYQGQPDPFNANAIANCMNAAELPRSAGKIRAKSATRINSL